MSPRRPSSPRSERSKARTGTSDKARGLDGHMDAATVGRHDDGDLSAILPIELAQCGLPVAPHHPGGRATWGAVYESMGHRATTCAHAGIERSRSMSQSAPLTRPARSSDSVEGRSVGRPRR